MARIDPTPAAAQQSQADRNLRPAAESELVRLQVGGITFETARGTLTSIPGKVLLLLLACISPPPLVTRPITLIAIPTSFVSFSMRYGAAPHHVNQNLCASRSGRTSSGSGAFLRPRRRPRRLLNRLTLRLSRELGQSTCRDCPRVMSSHCAGRAVSETLLRELVRITIC